jgi:hypothetical protein
MQGASDRAKAYGNLPLNFEENVGQTVQDVRFVAHGSGYELFLTPQEAVVSLAKTGRLDFSPMHRIASLRAMRAIRRAALTTVRLHLDGANPAVQMAGLEKLPVRTNYFVGNDPRKWHTNVPTYTRVKYSEVYPGVDLVFYGNQHRLEYDFVVAPGADPGTIAFSVGGARKLRVNSRGDLVMSVAGGEVELQKPVVYQQTGHGRQEIAGGYEITEGHRVRFAVAKYDHSAALIVDPVLNYSTYLGGTGDDQGASIAVDAAGDAFVTGTTFSTDFPTTASALNAGPLGSNVNGTAFVTEMNPAGTAQLYSTYLGGSGGDEGFGIAVDSTGNVYVTGSTFSTDFPTTANALKGGANAAAAVNGTSFLTKINPAASGAAALVYSSYIGGTSGAASDAAEAIAVDATGNAYVTGITGSLPGTGLADFPVTASAFQATPGTGITSGTAFLTRIDTTKSGSASLIYSTFLGGNGADSSGPLGFGDGGLGVAVDSASNAYIVGTTSSTNFPTSTNAFQVTAPVAIAKGTVFVSRIDTTMSGAASLIYSTYLGGDVSEFGFAIALGPNNVAYVTGNTGSPSAFPTTHGAFQTGGDTLNPNGDAFVSLIDTAGTGSTSLKYSTYLGDRQGSGDVGFGIKADSAGNAYVGGASDSTHFPVTKGAFEPTFPSAETGFISKLNPAGNGAADLVYSTYFGGSGSASQRDEIFGIAIDTLNNAYVTGVTASATNATRPFPTSAGAFQTALKGTSDAFVSKLTLIPTVVVAPASLAFNNQTVGVKSAPQMVTLTNNTSAALPITSVVVMAGSPAASSTDFAIASGSACVTSVAVGASCTLNVTFTPSATAAESATLVFTDGDASSPQSVDLTGNGAAVAADFSLSAPGTLTIAQGMSGSVTVTMTPVGGFTGAVALACTGAPMNSTCTIAPTSVTSSNGTATATATVTVMTSSLVPPANRMPMPPISMLQIVSMCFAGLTMLLLSKARRLQTRLGLAAALLICLALAGCGGGSSSNPSTNNSGTATPKATTTLTITGTSGALSHTATVSLAVD